MYETTIASEREERRGFRYGKDRDTHTIYRIVKSVKNEIIRIVMELVTL